MKDSELFARIDKYRSNVNPDQKEKEFLFHQITIRKMINKNLVRKKKIKRLGIK